MKTILCVSLVLSLATFASGAEAGGFHRHHGHHGHWHHHDHGWGHGFGWRGVGFGS